jgi:predicted nicotinamide N-methyase
MPKTAKTQIRAYGIRVLLSPHPQIRKLKRKHSPSLHGNMHWPSSWLMMDYFKRRGLPEGTRVTELGCGWGLAGIYCAKKHGAVVTGIDIDSEVFPYLHLHSDINKVEIATVNKSFVEMTARHLKNVDVLIGSDICFWNKMVEPLQRLIDQALGAGVQLVLIADPGRQTFEGVAKYSIEKWKAEVLDWTVRRPRFIRGKILQIRPRGKEYRETNQ